MDYLYQPALDVEPTLYEKVITDITLRPKSFWVALIATPVIPWVTGKTIKNPMIKSGVDTLLVNIHLYSTFQFLKSEKIYE